MTEPPVITGLGFITSIGNDRASVIRSLRHLETGLAAWDPVPGVDLPVKVAGTIKGFDTCAPDSAGWTWPDPWEVDRGLLRGLPPHGLYAACALEQALGEARLTRTELAEGSTGLFTASAGSPRMVRHHLDRLAASGWRRSHPLGVVMSAAGTLGFNFSAHYGITGSCCGFVSACASGSHALGCASDEIRLGRQERVIVLGLDNQDTTSFDAVFEFVRDTGLYECQITVMTAFPNAPLYERLAAQGRLLDPTAWETCTLFDVNYQPAGMSVAQLESGFRDLARRIYDSGFIEERRRRFFARQNERRQQRALAG